MQKFTELLFILLIPSFLFSQTGPGGVGDASTNSMWLKANQGTSTTVNDAKVASWLDASGNGNTMSQSIEDKKPVYVTNSFNGYPSITFDKTGTFNHLLSGAAPNTDGTNGITIFSAVKKTGTGADGRAIISKRTSTAADNSFMFFFYLGNRLYVDYEGSHRLQTVETFTNTDRLLLSTMFDGSLAATIRLTIYQGNTLLTTGTKTNTTIASNPAPVIIGATHTTDNRAFDGQIAEVITYRVALNETQRIIVNNYLSAKYDIPLTDKDLYTMDDSGNGNFDHEVAGIGSISPTDNHLVAQGSGIVEISNASNLDGKFLLWGHNNLVQHVANVSDVPTTVEARLERFWRMSSVTAAGVPESVGTVSVQFDLTNLGNVNVSDLRLLVSNIASFSGSTPISGAVHVSGNLYRFDGVSTADGNYFTLGTINKVITPLPITLLDFTAIKKVRNVVLNWSTASEQNNDRFEIERTTDGINWITIQTISGNGNSNTVIHYTGIDKNPTNGTNYYRLKQIDFNGEYTFSNVRSVVFTAPAELNVFPNPAKNIVTINRGADAVIQIINELGQIMHADQEISGNSTTFNLSGLNSGVYFVKVQDEDSIYNRKIIILQD